MVGAVLSISSSMFDSAHGDEGEEGQHCDSFSVVRECGKCIHHGDVSFMSSIVENAREGFDE